MDPTTQKRHRSRVQGVQIWTSVDQMVEGHSTRVA
jgi:hypothetical protein